MTLIECENYKKCINCNSENLSFEAEGQDYNYETTVENFIWVSCNKCGHFFLKNRPIKKFHKNIYPDTLKNYEEFTDQSLSFKIKNYLTYINLKKFINSDKRNLSVLDIGCASGTFLDIISSKFKQFSNFDGLDISETATKKAKEKGYNIFTSLIEDFKFENNYDLISMQQVIEHVHDPMDVIKKLYKNLNKDGILLIETPNPDCFDRIIFKGYWEGYHIPRHFNLFTIDNFKNKLKEIGFSKVIINKKMQPVHWSISIKHYLKDKKRFKFLYNNIKHSSFFLNLIFSFFDLFQIIFFGKSSNVAYIAIK